MTAIILAGRTSAAYTAELGSMRMNEEIDALLTLGVSPYLALVFPRCSGCCNPSSAYGVGEYFWCFRGMLMASLLLDIPPYDFLLRFKEQVSLTSYLCGLAKTPVFAMVIAWVGCFQGLQVQAQQKN